MTLYCDDPQYIQAKVIIDGEVYGTYPSPVEVELITDKCFYISNWLVRRRSENCNAFYYTALHNPATPASGEYQVAKATSEFLPSIDSIIKGLGGYGSLPSSWLFNDGFSVTASITPGNTNSSTWCYRNGTVNNNSRGLVNGVLFWNNAIQASSLKVKRTQIKINGTLLPGTYWNPSVEVVCISSCEEGTEWDEGCQDCVPDCFPTFLSITESIIQSLQN